MRSATPASTSTLTPLHPTQATSASRAATAPPAPAPVGPRARSARRSRPRTVADRARRPLCVLSLVLLTSLRPCASPVSFLVTHRRSPPHLPRLPTSLALSRNSCRKSKCKCTRILDPATSEPVGPCQNCITVGAECTFLGASRKRCVLSPSSGMSCLAARLSRTHSRSRCVGDGS